jgi:hypothetical protein
MTAPYGGCGCGCTSSCCAGAIFKHPPLNPKDPINLGVVLGLCVSPTPPPTPSPPKPTPKPSTTYDCVALPSLQCRQIPSSGGQFNSSAACAKACVSPTPPPTPKPTPPPTPPPPPGRSTMHIQMQLTDQGGPTAYRLRACYSPTQYPLYQDCTQYPNDKTNRLNGVNSQYVKRTGGPANYELDKTHKQGSPQRLPAAIPGSIRPIRLCSRRVIPGVGGSADASKTQKHTGGGGGARA